jgi:hypothetical protein
VVVVGQRRLKGFKNNGDYAFTLHEADDDRIRSRVRRTV